MYKVQCQKWYEKGVAIWCSWSHFGLQHTTNPRSQLSKFQRLALLSITRAMKSTPNAVLEALLNIEPLEIYIESVTRATCVTLLF